MDPVEALGSTRLSALGWEGSFSVRVGVGNNETKADIDIAQAFFGGQRSENGFSFESRASGLE